MDGAASNYFAEMTRIGLAGDVMLGRLVDGHVLANSAACSCVILFGGTAIPSPRISMLIPDNTPLPNERLP